MSRLAGLICPPRQSVLSPCPSFFPPLRLTARLRQRLKPGRSHRPAGIRRTVELHEPGVAEPGIEADAAQPVEPGSAELRDRPLEEPVNGGEVTRLARQRLAGVSVGRGHHAVGADHKVDRPPGVVDEESVHPVVVGIIVDALGPPDRPGGQDVAQTRTRNDAAAREGHRKHEEGAEPPGAHGRGRRGLGTRQIGHGPSSGVAPYLSVTGPSVTVVSVSETVSVMKLPATRPVKRAGWSGPRYTGYAVML